MRKRHFFLIVLTGTVLFLPFLGRVHLFDWDEINFAESAREMLVSGHYEKVQINFQPFWEKPPLFIWCQAISMKVFGINEFAARLPNALTGILTLLAVFYYGSRYKDRLFGSLWMLCFIGSFFPHFYFKTGLIDPLFNLFIFLGIMQFVQLSERPPNENRTALLAGLFIGLAILTKGPVALLIALVTFFFYWASVRFRPVIKLKSLALFFMLAFLVSSPWFAIETVRDGPWFILSFIQYQLRLLTTPDAGHGGPFYYHFVVLFFGCFPASVFLFSGFKSDYSETAATLNLRRWMTLLLITVLLIFSIVTTKIIHYSSLAWFPVTFLAAFGLHYSLRHSEKRFFLLQSLIILGLGILFAAAFIALPYIGGHMALIEPFIKDPFGKAALKAPVPWSGFEALPGIAFLVLIFVAAHFLSRRHLRAKGVVMLFAGSAACIFFLSWVVVPRIEPYSQGAAIEFFERAARERAYCEPLGYKSYAQYFYGRKQPQDNSSLLFQAWALKEKGLGLSGLNSLEPEAFNGLWSEWLQKGPLDKPAYFVCKIQNRDEILKTDTLLHFVEEKSGFVLLKRSP